MIPWLDRHRRFRDQLSPYLDGELAARPRDALERHLVSCAPCRQELAALRATARALAELPQAEVPRSFTLTPDQVRGPAPRPFAPRPPLAAPFLAGALAFALAAILVVDLGDIGGGGPAATRQEAPAAEERIDAYGDRAPAEEEAPATGADTGGGTGGTAGGGTAAGGAGGPAGATAPAPTPAPEALAPAPSPSPDQFGAADEAARAQPSPPPQAGPDVAPAAGEGDGLDPLRAAEIGLAAALGALVAGAAGYAAWSRRRSP